jgi:hypothetical protein
VSIELTRMENSRNLGGRGKHLMRVDLILHWSGKKCFPETINRVGDVTLSGRLFALSIYILQAVRSEAKALSIVGFTIHCYANNLKNHREGSIIAPLQSQK